MQNSSKEVRYWEDEMREGWWDRVLEGWRNWEKLSKSPTTRSVWKARVRLRAESFLPAFQPCIPSFLHVLYSAIPPVVLLLLWTSISVAASLPLGTLSHDGPATPEQISLYLPVTGPLNEAAGTIVHFRPTSGGEWIEAHPLHRIRVANCRSPKPADALAGVITGLEPGVSYDVKVTVELGTESETKNLTAATRTLPEDGGPVTRIIPAGSTSDQIQKIFDDAKPGDVIQFEEGIYPVDDLRINRGGTPSRPLYIRGASRKGVILDDVSGVILNILRANDVVIEDMTLVGSKTDSGKRAASRGINFWNGAAPQQRITIRRITLTGVDMGIVAWGKTEQLLVYDNTLSGNNVWEKKFISTNLTWNDDGIRVPGTGNAVFNNTLTGFGDAFAVNQGVKNIGIHFYRNDVRTTGDDAFETDYSHRNITFYDNRIHNSMTLVSVDPLYGGPLFVFRNITINVGRQPYKLNNRNTGFFLYNNTVVRTRGFSSGARWGWAQPNNGPLVAWVYRNNILIFQGTDNLMAMEPKGQDPINFTHNAWYPDGKIWWTHSGGCFRNLAEARSKLPATKPVFGKSTRRHEGDVISESDPFTEKIELGDDSLKQIVKAYTPKLAEGSAPRGKGVPIPGVTDGFSGKAPDMGALISGRPIPIWGDRSSPLNGDTPSPKNES